ncbi:T9SS type A sorting domain-containing protein [Membranihabitans maritimus]|uniref:T9SS type A sorting domain-containing protein n=1 Tax=Membranihabitans maritimus TaxID=2904244 RepID=UPI001F1ED9D5|nr:T9SS type A sorting domain-containing protein [Membranihabitans maritimus]
MGYSQFEVWTTIEPRLIYQGEHFDGNKGVQGLEFNIENKSVSPGSGRTASAYSQCNSGIGEMEIKYHTALGENEFDLYLVANDNGIHGLSIIDAILVEQHALGQAQLDNYNFIAGDADEDGDVDTTDTNLWQQAIMSSSGYWPSDEYWMAIQNADKHNFENASQNSSLYSYGYDPMENISVQGDPSSSGTVDNLFSFRIIKKGDLNASNCYYCWSSCSPPSLKKVEEINLDLAEQRKHRIRLGIDRSNGIAGLQWFLGYNEDELNIVDVRSDLPGFSKKDYRIENGELRVVHLAPKLGKGLESTTDSYIEILVESRSDKFLNRISTLHTNSIEIVDSEVNKISNVSLEVSGVDQSGYSLTQPSHQFYPNPVNNRLNTNIVSGQRQNVEIQLLDVQGKILYSDTWLMEKGKNTNIIDFANYASGVYFLRGLGEKGLSFHQKIIK